MDLSANIVAGDRPPRMEIREGLRLAKIDRRHDRDTDYAHIGDDSLRLHFKLSGENTVLTEDGSAINLGEDCFSLLLTPKDVLKHQCVRKGTYERSVTLACDRDFLLKLLNRSHPIYSRVIRDFLNREESGLLYQSIPLHPRLKFMAEEILKNDCDDGISSLMIESKAVELFCGSLNQFLNNPQDYDSLHPKSLQKVESICEYLATEAGMNRKIGDVARLFAWNDTQMRACFKQVTGTTIADYQHDLRMHRAKEQLLEGHLTIFDVAFNAGYEFPSNFATAFKRKFGVSPKTLRSFNRRTDRFRSGRKFSAR